jgi:hypothetical protein
LAQQNDTNHQAENSYNTWGEPAGATDKENNPVSKGGPSSQVTEPGWQAGLQKGDAEEQ